MKPTIGMRVLVGFAAMVAVALALGLYAVHTMSELRRIESQLTDRDIHVLEMIRDISRTFGAMRTTRDRAVTHFLLRQAKLGESEVHKDESEWRSITEVSEKQTANLQQMAAEDERTALSDKRRELWGKVRDSATALIDEGKVLKKEIIALFEILSRGDTTKLTSQLAEVDRVRQKLEQQLDGTVRVANDLVAAGSALSAATYDSARLSLLFGMAVSLVIGVLSSVMIGRSITGPMAGFMGFVERVGRGDLSREASASNVGDLDRLGQSLNSMVGGLRDLSKQTVNVVQNLRAATSQIVTSIQEQASSTKEQAATVQEVATTMDEISQTGAQIAARAKQIAASAEAASVSSNGGLQAVQDTTRTMNAIREQVEQVAENIVALSEKTQAVGEIIATVNDIAERSNLLALNAAIEAAAAGEQGNRFSVVANEMKSLADQAKESTVQVRTILGDIQKGINSSVMLTEEAVKRSETGKQQAEIAEGTIRQMAKTTIDSVQAFEQIIGAGSQQQIGIEQVAQGMKDIRQATVQTAAATTQMERAVVNLDTLGKDLEKSTGRYQL